MTSLGTNYHLPNSWCTCITGPGYYSSVEAPGELLYCIVSKRSRHLLIVHQSRRHDILDECSGRGVSLARSRDFPVKRGKHHQLVLEKRFQRKRLQGPTLSKVRRDQKSKLSVLGIRLGKRVLQHDEICFFWPTILGIQMHIKAGSRLWR
jgi:hypothetical protein